MVDVVVVYDAENQILGRFCSVVAKRLLKGEDVVVVNAEKAVVTGKPSATKKGYLEKVQRGDPLHGPFFPKTPDGILRRTVRGMLPWHKPRGRQAYKRLRVFVGTPEKIGDKKFDAEKTKMEKVKDADASKLRTKTMKLGEISVAIGAKKRW